MNKEIQQEFKTIRDTCLREHASKELWPSYYDRRYLEFLTFYELLPKKRYLRVLELGCGIGYYSAFLSKIADEVIATDLETIDPVTHSPGLDITRNFLKDLGIKNVIVQHASAEALPFSDNSFDLVFSSHVIEHVPQMDKAIKEINRVLKPGGLNFCVVPTTTDRIYAFFAFYIFLLQRTGARFFRLFRKQETKPVSSDGASATHSGGAGVYFKHLPFPPPHGVYPNYLTEIRKWTLGNWKKIITDNGSIPLKAQYGLQMNSLLPLLGNILPRTAARIYSLTRGAENKLAANKFFRYFGISTLLITEKKD